MKRVEYIWKLYIPLIVFLLCIAGKTIASEKGDYIKDGNLSSNADLSSMVANVGTLNPAFTPANTSYVINVGSNVASISIKSTLADNTATMSVNGLYAASGYYSPAIGLSTGQNTINVKVTAQNGNIKIYVITVNKATASAADLQKLDIQLGSNVSSYSPVQPSYLITVGNAINTAIITPTAIDPSSTITVNGTIISNGASTSVPLSLGDNSITIVIRSYDQSTSKTITIIINREGGVATITSFSPTLGKPGDVITINGSNFSNVTAVLFGGTNAASFNVISSSQISAVVDHGSSGNIEVHSSSNGIAVLQGFIYSSPVPLSFLSFICSKNSNSVILDWQVADPLDGKEFIIERSIDAVNFYKIGTVKIHTARSYHFVDNPPTQSALYYRIKSLTADNKFSYSSTQKILFGSEEQLNIFPNPVTNDNINIHIPGQQGLYKISIINSLGERIFTQKINHIYTRGNYKISLGKPLPIGLYSLIITGPDQDSKHIPIMINK